MAMDDTSLACNGSHDLKVVFREMRIIKEKLHTENELLKGKETVIDARQENLVLLEATLNEKGQKLERQYQQLEATIAQRVKQRCQSIVDKQKEEIAKLETSLAEKTKENRRLRIHYEDLQKSHDGNKTKFEETSQGKRKLEGQVQSLQARVNNLLRKSEYEDRQRAASEVAAPQPSDRKQSSKENIGPPKSAKSQSKTAGCMYDTMAILLEWVCDTHLRHIGAKSLPRPDPGLTNERCFRALPRLVEVMNTLPGSQTKIHQPCLQFVYWTLYHIDNSLPGQKSSIAATCRRIGEELYRPGSVTRAPLLEDSGSDIDRMSSERQKATVFFHSPNLHIRFLSCLIILKTITQADFLAHTFEVLRSDLKTDAGKELFLAYQATTVVLPFMKGVNRALTNSAVEIYLLMSMESVCLTQFLESCSNESWFRICTMLLRTPNLDAKQLEKISIVLQKLSKMKSNKRYFDQFNMGVQIQELWRAHEMASPFLALNLQAVLFNLNLLKGSN